MFLASVASLRSAALRVTWRDGTPLSAARGRVPPQAAPPQAAPTGDAAPPGPPKWVAVALNLLPRGKLSVTAVKIQVLHAAERDGTPLSAAVWLDVLEVCEERGIDGKRVMELQEGHRHGGVRASDA